MELRKDIEQFALWYVPVYVISTMSVIYFQDELMATIENYQSYKMTMLGVKIAGGLVGNVVAAIWLYVKSKESQYRPFIWFALGLVTNLLGVVIFIGIKIYEEKTFNKSMLSQPTAAGTPQSGATN